MVIFYLPVINPRQLSPTQLGIDVYLYCQLNPIEQAKERNTIILVFVLSSALARGNMRSISLHVNVDRKNDILIRRLSAILTSITLSPTRSLRGCRYFRNFTSNVEMPRWAYLWGTLKIYGPFCTFREIFGHNLCVWEFTCSRTLFRSERQ